MKPYSAKEFKIVSLRECVVGETLDDPKKCYDYWQQHIAQHPYYNADQEMLYALLLNTRLRIMGHHLVDIGTLDAVLVSTREVFRAAIIANASSIVLMHNHPSGDPTPSDTDIKITRDLIRAGQLMKIDVKDHVIAGKPATLLPGEGDLTDSNNKARWQGFYSLREKGYFYV